MTKPSDRIKHLAGVLPTEGTSPAERLVVATLAYLDEQAAASPSPARTDLTWERGWDLLRKARMGAVVDAARAIDARYWKPKDEDIIRPLRVALAALDEPSQPEPASEPRAIVVGSKWMLGANMIEVTVSGKKYVGYSLTPGQGVSGAGVFATHDFAMRATWVSDPGPPASETAEGEPNGPG